LLIGAITFPMGFADRSPDRPGGTLDWAPKQAGDQARLVRVE
jgi:hypothetical protein